MFTQQILILLNTELLLILRTEREITLTTVYLFYSCYVNFYIPLLNKENIFYITDTTDTTDHWQLWPSRGGITPVLLTLRH
jgi:hypothetical protein